MPSEDMLVIVETDDGPIMRTVQPASPLPQGEHRGIAAESAARRSAAIWGLPDLIFEPLEDPRGDSVREVSDGIAFLGHRALMIQSKSRTELSESSQRETQWLDKNIARAIRQASGSIRTLQRSPRRMQNRRGRHVLIGKEALQWLTVVLIDHDRIPEGYVPSMINGLDAAVLTRRDWDFLFEHLRSTSWVADYLRRVAGEPIELGHEPARYYELALADKTATPAGRPGWAPDGSHSASSPRAPLRPAGEEDTNAHFMLRVIQEDIARTDIPEEQEWRRLTALLHLDRVPLGMRTELGTRLIQYTTSTRG